MILGFFFLVGILSCVFVVAFLTGVALDTVIVKVLKKERFLDIHDTKLGYIMDRTIEGFLVISALSIIICILALSSLIGEALMQC